MNENNKRIAKNTMMLYFRTFITMIVGLYTSRILLEALGIDNYGIFNVVGGIVSFSSLLVGTMSTASSRYITFALGEGILEKMKNVFTTVANAHLILGIIAVIVFECIGVWFLNTTANIPNGRMYAANWVLQFSIIGLFISVISVPYTASIIAHEKMGIYAWMSIIEAVFKLIICYVILSYGGDKLILYSFLLLMINIVITTIYMLYGMKSFAEVKYSLKVDKSLLKEISSFSGWNLISNASWVFSTSGINMLINVFFGVVYNAAVGIATTVNNCIQSFVNNFTTAFKPQLIKAYASKNYTYCYQLVNRGVKFTWYLMYIFIVPVCVEAEEILNIWLVEVPPLCTLFLRLALFQSLAIQSGDMLFTLIQATGDIKRYTVLAALYAGLVFPLTWIFYKIGFPIWISYVIFIFIFFTINIIRLYVIRNLTTYNWKSYIYDVLKPCIIVSVMSFVAPVLLKITLSTSIINAIIIILVSFLSTVFTIFLFGLEKEERNLVVAQIKKIANKFIHING